MNQEKLDYWKQRHAAYDWLCSGKKGKPPFKGFTITDEGTWLADYRRQSAMAVNSDMEFHMARAHILQSQADFDAAKKSYENASKLATTIQDSQIISHQSDDWNMLNSLKPNVLNSLGSVAGVSDSVLPAKMGNLPDEHFQNFMQTAPQIDLTTDNPVLKKTMSSFFQAGMLKQMEQYDALGKATANRDFKAMADANYPAAQMYYGNKLLLDPSTRADGIAYLEKAAKNKYATPEMREIISTMKKQGFKNEASLSKAYQNEQINRQAKYVGSATLLTAGVAASLLSKVGKVGLTVTNSVLNMGLSLAGEICPFAGKSLGLGDAAFNGLHDGLNWVDKKAGRVSQNNMEVLKNLWSGRE